MFSCGAGEPSKSFHNMSEDSARVTFDWVLDQVRWLLQVSSPAELGTLFRKMLEAQVFPNYHYLSPCEEEHSLWERGACETDREDLARRMALPMWQRWDACQGILQSVLHQEAVSSLECPGISCESSRVSVGFVFCFRGWPPERAGFMLFLFYWSFFLTFFLFFFCLTFCVSFCLSVLVSFCLSLFVFSWWKECVLNIKLWFKSMIIRVCRP